jgi:hypothetical protein
LAAAMHTQPGDKPKCMGDATGARLACQQRCSCRPANGGAHLKWPAPMSHLSSSRLLLVRSSRTLATNLAGSQYPGGARARALVGYNTPQQPG